MGPNPYALVVTGEESTRKWVMVYLYLYALVIGHGNQYGEEEGGGDDQISVRGWVIPMEM